jgi:hypothetical protein
MYLDVGEGTFYTSGGVTFGSSWNTWAAPYGPFTRVANYLTIRGQGPNKTKFVTQTTGIQCGPQGNTICMFGSQDGPANASQGYAGGCKWTSGYAVGGTILTLSDCITGQTAPNQNGMNNQVNGMPVAGMRVIIDQRNDDVGMLGCSSSGTTATCVLSVQPPAAFTVNGPCLGISSTGNAGIANVAAGTANTGQVASGYNVTLRTPQRYTGTSAPQTCIAQITAMGTDNSNVLALPGGATHLPTISYTLPQEQSDIPTWYCGTNPNAATRPVWGTVGSVVSYPVNEPLRTSIVTLTSAGLPSGAWGNVYTCWATVDNGGLYVTGAPCVTSAGNCSDTGSASLLGGLDMGRMCPDARYDGSGATRPWMKTCHALGDAANGYGLVGNEVSWRSQARVETVMAVCTGVDQPVAGCQNTNQIVVDPPLKELNWRAESGPGVYWMHTYVHDVGVEDLTIDAINDGGTSVNSSVSMNKCYNCWLKNIRSLTGSRNHVWIYLATQHAEIRDSYFWGCKRGGSQSYGLEAFSSTTDALFENNLMVDIVSPIMNGGAQSSVEAYNFATGDQYYQPQYMMGRLSINHDLSGYNLFEGNNLTSIVMDNIHGAMNGPSTNFRNRMRGQQYPRSPIKNNGITAIINQIYNRGVSFIGNVMGMSPIAGGFGGAGMVAPVVYQAPIFQGPAICGDTTGRTIYCGGSNSQKENVNPQISDDPITFESLFRWGNYDRVSATTPVGTNGSDGLGVRWCGTGSEANCAIECTPNVAPRWASTCSEVSGGIWLLPAVPVPSSTTLPASFYLSSQPSWFVTPWGTPHWPPIGPDVNGGDNVLPNGDDASGHSYMIPAQLVELNAPIDTTYVESRNRIDTAHWASNTMTLTGAFYIDLYASYRIDGATPAGFNGIFNVATTTAPQPTYQNGSVCGGPTACAGMANPRNNVQYAGAAYMLGFTRVAPDGTETPMGQTARPSPNITPACTGQNQNPAGGATNCTIRVPGLSTAGAGTGATASAGWNLYIGSQAGLAAGVMCRQNTTPIPNNTATAANPNSVYFQQDPVILALDGNGNANPLCIHPPSENEIAATQITSYWPFNPCGSGTTCDMVAPMGHVTWPLIRQFDANAYYGVGELPPQPPTASIAVNPSQIQPGGSALLSWITGGADTVTITGLGPVASSGSQTVAPGATTSFVLTASNANGSTNATAILTVGTQPPPPTIVPTINGLGVVNGSGVVK